MGLFNSAVSAIGTGAVVTAGGLLHTAAVLGNLAFHGTGAALRIASGGQLITMQKSPWGAVKVPMFSPTFQRNLVGTAAVAGLGFGAYSQMTSQRWTVNSGMEVERDDFLGATGGMALNMGRRRSSYSNPLDYRTAALHMSDDVARLFL